MDYQQREFSNSNVLVVGGAGFVGSNLVKMILSSNVSVRIMVVDNLMSAERENLPLENSNLTFIEGSITEEKVLKRIEDDSTNR